MTHFALLTLSLVLCSLNQAASEVHYITTNSTDLFCISAQPCLTLSQFADNSSHYLHSNTTLVFLPGTHLYYLSTVDLTLSDIDNFVMKSENSTAQIKCTNDSQSYIHFSQSQCIHITNLEFIGCGGNQVRHVEEFAIEDKKFEGQENSSTALELIETTAQIVNSTFVSNKRGTYRECAMMVDPEYGCTPGGFISGAIIATNSTADISQSKFEDNEAEFGGDIFAEQHSIINMSGNEFIINSAVKFGGALHSDSSNVTINVCEFRDNNVAKGGEVLSAITVTSGGGVLSSLISTITIEASKFHNNSATGPGGVLSSYNSDITLEASEFHDNSATYAGGVLGSVDSIIIIEASEFHNNNATYGGVLGSSSDNITIETSEFHDNSPLTVVVYYTPSAALSQ